MRLIRPMKRSQTTGPLEVPVSDGVLLGVEVLLGPGVAGKVLLQLEGGAVDAVAGRQGGRQDQADGEDRRPPLCSCSVRMSGVLGQKLGRK